MDSEIKREIIMENYLHPYHKESIDNEEYIKVNTNNESCIDNIDLQILIKYGKIADIKFEGEACAISTASTSIMIRELIGKEVDDAIKFIDNFQSMVDEKEYDKQMFEQASVFEDIYKQNNRKTCVTLPYRGMRKALIEYEKKNI